MKDLVKPLLPDTLRQALRQRRARQDWGRLMRAWEEARQIPRPAEVTPERRILILPSDLGQITGALGDDAMITATIEQAEARLGPVEVDMIGRPAAREVIRAKGFEPIDLPPATQFPGALAEILRTRRHAAVVVLGADILDGYYNPTAALLRLICADLAARAGVPATILGSSFNERPAPALKQAFETMDPAVRLNMRDKISLTRLNAFAKIDARLVADSAFTLTPGTTDPTAASWIEQERTAGRTVLGLNVHPMLIRDATPEQVARIIRTTAEAVTKASEGQDLSWVMIPHDYRGERGDGRCLRPVHEELTAAGVRSHFLEGEHRAADLKALAGLTDGVVTGRMHLAIAALGMGVPTLSLTYQDKFEGLYRHFGLPEDLLLPPAIFDDANGLTTALTGFADALPRLSATVAERKPSIKQLAGLNFDVMGEPVTA